ncbi:hypothetical protein SteCoe_3744 [Stentor coeruleus]|uniref:Cation-transporting P-type ATPase C-terminal domain-containing protein n=1 Tax=Stentor coeruleus TaxID=5963 RepID=A0A1R2CWA9_9CILI|nr:hypothetical protein SteCoe_3744 [Stentor coeruleus]
MEGLTTLQAKQKLLQILDEYRYLNRKQPLRHRHLYVKSIWALELLVYLYGLFLILDFTIISQNAESLTVGIFLLALPLRYIYYKANRSKFQWEIFDDRINKIYNLVSEIREGEDMSDMTLRYMNDTIVEVCRDGNWVKLPSVILLEGDLVALRPGMYLPAEAYGLDGHFKDRVLMAFEILPHFESTDLLEAKQKVHFVLRASPLKILLQKLLADRGAKKKKTATFFIICLKKANKVLIWLFLGVLVGDFVFAGIWAGTRDVKYVKILLNSAFLFVFITIVILPSLLHLLTCWGNALLWCICQSLDQEKALPRRQRYTKHLDPIIRNTHGRNVNLFETQHLADKAHSEFENEEMISLFPPVGIFECFSICRSFLIGGLQRDHNILDLLNNATVMSFIDKDGIISENARFPDEVIVMSSEEGIIALDLAHQSPLDIQFGNCDQDQVMFIGNTWEAYVDSLKPLGLATLVSKNPRIDDNCKKLVNLNDDHPKLITTGELFFLRPKDEIEIFEECACIIGKSIGFTDDAIKEYKYHCTLWSTWRPDDTESLHDISYRRINKKNILKNDFALSDYIDQRISQAKRISAIQERLLRPCHLLTNIIEKDGDLQVFSQGNPKVVLQNCKYFWNGSTLQPLEEDDLQHLNTALLQWIADDYDAFAFSYKPLISEEIEMAITDRGILENIDETTREALQAVQRGHIFLGVIAITNHPKEEANHFIEDVFTAGIRFVIFSEGNLLETKAFGDDLGLYTAWNSCISLRAGADKAEEQALNQDGMKVLPQGIEEIKTRLDEYNDNVPLLVSMFSDSSKPAILEMVKIYQQHGEVAIVLGDCLHAQNMSIYQIADISIGVKTQPCGFCSSCYGYRLNYKHTPGPLESACEKLISLPCTFTLGLDKPLYVVLQVIKEARKFMANIQNGLLFAVTMYISFTILSFILLAFGLPPFVTLLQCSYISFIIIPALTLSFLSTPSEPEIMKKLPIKEDILEIIESDTFFMNHIIRIIYFIAILIQMHVWGLSIIIENQAFYKWTDSGDKILNVQVCNFWYAVFLITIYSSGYINSSQSWFQVRPINGLWYAAVFILGWVMAFVIVVIYLGVYIEFVHFKDYLGKSWYVYLTIFFECILSFFILELLNVGTLHLLKRIQKTIDAYFQTKLGVYSPK